MDRISRTLNQLHHLRASRVDTNDTLRLIEFAMMPEEDHSAQDNSAALQ
jgi:hypothetical protein